MGSGPFLNRVRGFVWEKDRPFFQALISGYGENFLRINIPIVVLKCHWDQNFGIPYFCIFENSLWLLVTIPNFNSLRRLEVAFFGRFLSRFCGRHYWPLFRKPACELAEVTLEAHLKLSTFHTVTCHGKFNSRPGKISCQPFAVRP